MRLQGKIAVVTGGGSGIGEALCKKFAKEGAAVVVAGLPDDPVQDVAAEIVQAGAAPWHSRAILASTPPPKTA